jgi:hypothetical protein
MSTIFQASFILVAPFWFLMVFLPHWRWSKRIINSPFIIAPAALLYAILVLPLIGDVLPAVMNPTLDGVAALMASEAGATIGWVHFLAFDLFVGRWAYLDSQKRGISAWLMAPVLYFTLMLGPIGFLLYLLARAGHERVTR